MLSPSPGALDALQTSPPPRFHQTPEWYERQQTTNSQTNSVFARPSPGGSLFLQGHPYEQVFPNRDLALQLRSLQQHYTILDGNNLLIELLGEEPALYALLVEAVRPLQIAFGEGRIIQLRVQVSDDDRFLKVAVQWPANFGDAPERALRSFDAGWWLRNCHRSGGALVFDYEIQDAV